MRLLFTLVNLVLLTVMNGQTLLFKNVNVEDGLPSSELHHVMQDRKGFIWICGSSGVARYDGYTFHLLNADKRINETLFLQAFEDDKGRLWFRGVSGTIAFLRNDTIVPFRSAPDFKSEIRGYNYALSMHVDQEDRLWIGTANFLVVYDVRTGQKLNYDFKPSGILNYVDIGDRGSVVYKTSADTTLRPFFTSFFSDGRIVPLFPKTKIKGNHTLIRSARLKKGNILYSYDNILWQLKADGSLIGETQPALEAITAIFEDAEENLWIGVKNAGVLFFPKGNLAGTREQFLQGNSITGIIQDTEGAYWFTTLENGMYYLRTKNVYKVDIRTGTQNPKVSFVCKLSDTRYVSGVNDHLAIIDDTVLSTLDLGKFFGKDYVIQCLAAGRDQSVYLGGTRSGIVKYSFPGKPQLLLESLVNVKHLINTGDETYWGCSPFSVFKIESDKLVATYPVRNRVHCILKISDGSIVIGGTNGVSLLDKDEVRELKIFDTIRPNIISMKEAGNGLLLGTKSHGLIHLNWETKKWQRLSIKNTTCNDIQIDKNIIWVAGTKGIDRVDPDSKIMSYNTGNGILSNENHNLVLMDSALVSATSKGLMKLDLSGFGINTYPPPVYIQSISSPQRELRVDTVLTLKHDENFITIRYTGLSYSTKPLLYRFKMTGLDSNWTYSTNTSVQFAALGPGQYKFNVYAINSNAIESLLPATIYIEVIPPFWKKWWFILGVSLATLLCSYFLFAWRIRYLRQQDTLKKRIAEIEAKALKAQMNPHFIFNCLGSIQNFILKNDVVSAEYYLGMFSKLIRQVLENSSLSSTSLEEEIRCVELYIQLELLRFNNRFSYTIDVASDINTMLIEIPCMLIQPFVENAIWHGLLHKNSKGNMKIILSVKDEFLFCVIEDNGVGRRHTQTLKASNEAKKSLGIAITAERLEVLNMQFKEKTLLQITDLYGPDGKSAGTRVTLKIPIVRNL